MALSLFKLRNPAEAVVRSLPALKLGWRFAGWELSIESDRLVFPRLNQQRVARGIWLENCSARCTQDCSGAREDCQVIKSNEPSFIFPIRFDNK